MNDLERIKHIEETLGIKLHQVSLENLFTENFFLTDLQKVLGYIQNPYFSYKGVRNYSLDKDGNVTGLGLDYCTLSLLEYNYLGNLKHLKKVKLKNTGKTDYNFLFLLENLEELDLSNNKLSNVDFLKDLKGLKSLDLSQNNLSKIDFLKGLKGLKLLNLFQTNTINIKFFRELENLTSLSLGNNELLNIESLRELTNLSSLDLRTTNLTNIDFLKELKGLSSLYLGHNKFTSNIDFLGDFTNLTSLDLRNTDLSSYEFLRDLKSIAYLDLSYNLLSDIDFLKELTANLNGLTSLYLGENSLSNVDFLGDLKGLNSLELGNNRLTDLSFLKDLKALTSLDIRNLDLLDYDFLKELKGLTSIYLSGNKLFNIDYLNDLKNLVSLNLSNNNLSNANSLANLTNLTSLDLSHNNLSSAEFLSELKNLTTLSLQPNPNLDLPTNLMEKIATKSSYYLDQSKIDQIRNYYKQLEEQGKDYIYEARVLIVGEPGAGKTTLYRKLKDNKYIPIELTQEEKDSTVGVEIEKEWTFNWVKDESKRFIGHLWDFGGQKIQYALHQYFLSEKALYILLADDRKQLNNFHYWFEIIATLGANCPVLVVLNEINHQSITNFSLKTYKEQYGNKVKSIESRDVDFSKDDGRFKDLKSDIQTKLSNLEHIGTPIPARWKVIRKEIENPRRNNAYISLDDFYKICADNQIPNKKDADNLLDYLHTLGIALNYKNDHSLEEKVFLKPGWIIDALYAVLKNKNIKKACGRFEKSYVYDLWQGMDYKNQNYQRNDCNLLLSLMLKGKFEIGYQLGQSNQYIVPLLLPEVEPEYTFEENRAIQLIVEYKFMPAGILSRLIVRLNEKIIEQNKNQIVWEKGVLLGYKKSMAEVIEIQNLGQIRIRASGNNFIQNKEAITTIRNELDKINSEWFEGNLDVDELVPCICEVCKDLPNDEKQVYSLQVLEDYLNDGDDKIKCDLSRKKKNRQDVKVRALLEGVYIEDKTRGENNLQPNNIFNIAKVAKFDNQPN